MKLSKLFGKKQSDEERQIEQHSTISGHMVWKDQDFYRKALRDFGLSIRGIPEIRCYFLQSALRSLHDLTGDVAECGTRKGKSALYMASACERPRDFFLFDSFEGLSDPAPGKDILASAYESDGKHRIFHENYAEIEERFRSWPNINLMRGWIPDRFPEVAERSFVLIHVDVDLYQPTLDSFEYFYPRTVPGGFIICDDYGSGNYPGARAAMDEFFADKPEKPVELPQGQAFVVKR